MQSPPSTTASPTDIKESLSLAAKAQAVVDKRSQIKGESKEPAESALKTLSYKPFSPERAKEVEDNIAREARREREARKVSIIERSGLPARHLQQIESGIVDSDGGEWSSAMAIALKAVKAKKSALLWGHRGPGKTQIAVCVGVDLARECKGVRYYKAADFFTECREAMHDNKESAAIKKFVQYHLLIIDEAHVRGHSDYEERLLTRVFDGRYDAMRPTMVITNETKGQANKTLGPSIVSRLVGDGVVIECNWTSYRKKSDDRPHTTRHA